MPRYFADRIYTPQVKQQLKTDFALKNAEIEKITLSLNQQKDAFYESDRKLKAKRKQSANAV